MKKKITFFKILLLAVVLLVGSGSAWGQTEQVIYSTGFESSESFTSSTTYNNATIKYDGATGQQWGTYYGTASTTAPISESQSMQMRYYTASSSNLGYTFTNFDLSKVTKVTFKALNTSGNNVAVSYSTDGGSTYTGAQTFTLATSSADFTYNISATGEFTSVRIKFQLVPGSTNGSRITIDNVTVYGITNSTSAATPTFSPAAGTYTSVQNVTLSSTTSGALIYYTTDGSTPSSTSTLYTGSIALNTTATTTIKAIAYDASNANPSSIASATYTINLNPAITVSTATLTGFIYPQGVGPSSEKTFTVSGVNLTHDISIAAATNYEISLSSGTGYTTPLTLTQSSGTIPTTTVYVRLKAGLTQGDYNSEVINVSSTDATSATVICSGSVTAPPSSLPVYENFDYTSGTDLTANGWNVTGTNSSPTVAVSASSISYSGYLSSGIGNETTLSSSGGQDVNRTFAAQTLGTVYASFLVNVTSATTSGDYFFHLGAQTIGTTYKGRVFVKKDDSNNIYFGIAQATGTPVYTTTAYALGTTYLVVLKYSIVSGTDNDVASIYINPTLNTVEPSSGWLVNTDSPTDPSNIGSVALRQGSSTSAPGLKLDGIRVSTSWADIVGALPTFSGTGDWTETARWSTGSVPGTSANVIIDGDAAISTNTVLDGITINSGKSLTVNAAKQLTVSNSLTNNGTLNLLSSASGTATILTPATISGSGAASVQQYLTGALNSGTGYPNGRFWYVATPVTGVKSNVFNAAATANKLWYYTESAHGYTEITDNATILAVGTGYVARLGAADTTVNFSGTGLYTGDKTISLTYNSGNAKSGFNLIGNPYPSFLDWQQVQDWHADPYTSPINPTIWIRSFSGTAMGFDTYNSATGAGVSSNGNTVTQYIAPLQAFWVETSASSSITLTNTMRYAQDQTASGNKLKSPAVNAATQQLLRLQVSNSTNSDESIIAFNANASDAYDRYDSHKMLNDEVSIPEIYTYAGDHQLAINCMNSIIFNKEYALGFSAAETNNFEIKATEINNFDTGTKVILKDKLLNQETELTVGTAYSFASDAATTSDRFSIIFRAAGDVTGVDADKEQNILVYRNGNNQITVVCNAALDNSSSVSVYNAVGQKLTRQKLTGATTVINAAFTPGVYVVMVNNAGKQQISKMAIK